MTGRRHETSYGLLVVLVLLAGAVIATWIALTYRPNQSEPMAVKKVEIDGTVLGITDYTLFNTGNMWGIVNLKNRLNASYTPKLVATPVPHTPDAAQIGQPISSPLTALFAEASKDGAALVVSSAYRSTTDQQRIYSEYLAMNGQQYVHDYVAEPGASEHQSGLAVDFSTNTPACLTNGQKCSLDASSIAWLRAKAANYGFIERYPEGKQSITGIAGEHWHYRYVGVPLAQALTASSMTLDEFTQQTAPGYMTR